MFSLCSSLSPSIYKFVHCMRTESYPFYLFSFFLVLLFSISAHSVGFSVLNTCKWNVLCGWLAEREHHLGSFCLRCWVEGKVGGKCWEEHEAQ